MKKKKLLYVSIAFGRYVKFIPYFILSIINNTDSLDEIGILIYLENNSNSKRIKKWLQGYPEFYKLVELKEIPEFVDLRHIYSGSNTSWKICSRWMVNLGEYVQYRYALILDIDILILEDTNEILNFHKKRLEENGLPFSNIIREVKTIKFENADKRITGIHFVEIKPYYKSHKKTLDLMSTYDSSTTMKIIDDEVFLYFICKQAFNFEDKNLIKNENRRPWHGIHLGAFRGPYLSKKRLMIGVGDKKNLFLDKFERMFNTKDFIFILYRFPFNEIFFFTKQFSKNIKIIFRIYYYYYYLRYWNSKVVEKFKLTSF